MERADSEHLPANNNLNHNRFKPARESAKMAKMELFNLSAEGEYI